MTRFPLSLRPCFPLLFVLAGTPAAAAVSQPGEDFSLGLTGTMSLGATVQDPAPADDTAPEGGLEPRDPAPVFGRKGTTWWSASTSAMVDDGSNYDYTLRLGYHNFIAEDFEFNLAVTGWLHDQPNDDELSISFDLGFRYHFVNNLERGWSLYADLGIGFMLAGGEVPEGGTHYNFTPRVAFGTTMRLPEALGGRAGGRLDLSTGWQHYSNASTAGSDQNPARDSIFFRIGVMFPF